MKIYFGFTVVGDRSSVETSRCLMRCLEDLGHEVLTRHLVDDDARSRDRSLGPLAVYERDMEWLRQCDLFVGEVSGSSFGLGYEAGYLLGATSKRVILLYDIAMREKVSLLITGNTHPNCVLVPYASLEDAEAFVKNYLGRAGRES
jgi:nucleoside 2-deoxyribosyltransferase